MSNLSLFGIISSYLAVLFGIAWFAEKNARSKWVNNPYVYTLSLAVYCSAWTYYGSIGMAAESGVRFFTIYLGPLIAFPTWIIVMRKILRISRQHKISSLADFLSLRYGNHRFVGALVTLICLLATIPYISLQLKAVSETFEIMTGEGGYISSRILDDSTFYIAVLLAVFAAFFGTQRTDATEKHRGIVAAVAFESVLKLLFFVLIGGYVTFYLFDGTEDIYQQISQRANVEQLVTLGSIEEGFDWMFSIGLSFIAIFLLPRQFQMTVVENSREKHLKTAIWLFPLYLLLFSVFVIYLAWGGTLTFGDSVDPDYYPLFLPLKEGHTLLALLVFLGGFSAAISMVVVSTLALSTMVSNNLVIPYGFLDFFSKGDPQRNATYIKNIRRISIILIIMGAYLFYQRFSIRLSLYSIGLISFVVIAQLAPGFFIGLFWNRASSKATITGILAGVAVIVYTLFIPIAVDAFGQGEEFLAQGLFGWEALRPQALFGIDFLSPPSHAFFWSIGINLFCYLTISLLDGGNYRERNYAEMYVQSSSFSALEDSALVWKGEAYVADIRNVLVKFLGEKHTQRALNIFFRKYDLPTDTQMADARLINFSEKLLTGIIGSASARILIAGVVKEQEISLVEVLKILDESKENISRNKSLREKSAELTRLTNQLTHVNEELRQQDKQKDEFLDTVAHELKTPVTGIRAAAELLLEDEADMPPDLKTRFLSNILQDSERLSRLINHILDFEKLASGREQLNMTSNDLKQTILKAVNSISHLAGQQRVFLQTEQLENVVCSYDEDRMLQVLTNLLSNALKFAAPGQGRIEVSCIKEKKQVVVRVSDNGTGIPNEDLPYIFDKFYQSRNQNTQKPKGSGLGLAICKQIIEKHEGQIWAENRTPQGACLIFTLPLS